MKTKVPVNRSVAALKVVPSPLVASKIMLLQNNDLSPSSSGYFDANALKHPHKRVLTDEALPARSVKYLPLPTYDATEREERHHRSKSVQDVCQDASVSEDYQPLLLGNVVGSSLSPGTVFSFDGESAPRNQQYPDP